MRLHVRTAAFESNMLSFGAAIAVLLCLTSAQKPRQKGESFNLTTHSNLTLHPKHRGISKQEWRLGREVKIAVWEKGFGYSYPAGPFQGRVTINETSITLFDLRPNDSTTLIYFTEDSVGTEEEYPYVLSIKGMWIFTTYRADPQTDISQTVPCAHRSPPPTCH